MRDGHTEIKDIGGKIGDVGRTGMDFCVHHLLNLKPRDFASEKQQFR